MTAAVPLVLIHGVGLDHTMWGQMREHLAPRPVLAFDMLGHGDAPSAHGPFSLADFVEQLRAVIAADGSAVVDLVGFSMGALVAQGFAATHPTAVRRLVLVNAVFNRSAAERAAILARVDDVRNGGYQASIDAALDRWFTATYRATHVEQVQRVRRRLERNDASAYAAAYAVFATADEELVDTVERIECPTLVVTGSDDQRSTPQMTAALAAALSDGSAHIIDGVRHMTPLEAAPDLAALINEFCESRS